MGGPAYNNQFMAHTGPRGPPGGMGPGPGPTRGPPSMGPMYGPGGGPQRVPQHPNYGPGPQQGHLRPPQGLKRPYSSEVRVRTRRVYMDHKNQMRPDEITGTRSKSSSSPQSFPGMSQQYGAPLGSGVNVMSGPGGSGSGGGGHAGPGPYSGPNMQYHPGQCSFHETVFVRPTHQNED